MFVKNSAGVLVATGALILAGSAIAYAALPAGSVGTAQLHNGAVTAPKLATSAVTGPKIASSAVSSGKLLNGAVIGSKLASGSVTTSKLAADARDRAPYYVYDANSGIQSVTSSPSLTLGHLTFSHPGYYFVTYDLRVFSQGPGASSLYCDFGSQGGFSLVNTYVPANVTQITQSGIYQVSSAGQLADLVCHTYSASVPNITATYDMTGIKVVP
jgi:hypothetical protein